MFQILLLYIKFIWLNKFDEIKQIWLIWSYISRNISIVDWCN